MAIPSGCTTRQQTFRHVRNKILCAQYRRLSESDSEALCKGYAPAPLLPQGRKN